MRVAPRILITNLSLVLTLVGCSLTAQAQSGPSIAEQLKAQYKLVKLGVDSGGLAVTQPGTVLSVLKGGILGVPPANPGVLTSKFEDGNLKPPSMFLQRMMKETRFFTVGEKVYVTKIDVNVDKDRIAFTLIECDTCNNVNQPASYKSGVVFQFAKGSLQSAGVPQIEDTIGQLFAIGDSGDAQQQDQGGGGNNGGGGNGGNGGGNGSGQGDGQGQQGDQQQQQETQTIQLGQTPEQVQTAMGQPPKVVNLGPKQIYLYKDLKVTFTNGKVTDIQ